MSNSNNPQLELIQKAQEIFPGDFLNNILSEENTGVGFLSRIQDYASFAHQAIVLQIERPEYSHLRELFSRYVTSTKDKYAFDEDQLKRNFDVRNFFPERGLKDNTIFYLPGIDPSATAKMAQKSEQAKLEKKNNTV